MENVINQEPWWSLLLRGIFLIILGILAFAWPVLTIEVLMLFFGAFVLVDGIFAISTSVSQRKAYKHWGLTMLGGIVGIVVGLLIFLAPFLAGLVVLYLIAAWFLIIGIIRIVTAIRMRKEMAIGLLLTLAILSVCFGIAVFIIPLAMMLAILWVIAAFAIVIGLFLLAGGIQARITRKATS